MKEKKRKEKKRKEKELLKTDSYIQGFSIY